ncbi:tRNA lysidine(34) synthetase TilS [Paraflavitalea soli]|uniref:tRNA(Ile)-lysidine synthase n=1 Tax=Paraflavitalea soli TaxID=2315862 RepID=A0A3B7MIC3_9BACT|nr:tRNA lysidine(34) synthetase TilS [Paraflavitalea soli]AXY72796.1 tRNA lysidine(34) synthetase TilS [Paraflavitalea soli]
MSLLKRFIEYVEAEHLFAAKDTLLLAVSGGVDSVVLCALCQQAGYDFVIAHCNFQLRSTESERDEQFVRELGKKYGKEVLVKRFDTTAYAAQQKVSVQVAARELRYGWFEEIVQSRQSVPPFGGNSRQSGSPISYDKETPHVEFPIHILTAHHLDDNIETVLMKFFKGTGVAGLRGILPKQGKIVRPLLFAKKDELLEFAKAHQLDWVEDSSNEQDKYARNYVRHQVVPLLQKIYPEVVDNLADNIARFREVEVLYRQSVEGQQKKLLEYKGNEIHIPVLKLKKAVPLATLVYEIAKPFGFSAAQTGEIIHLLDSESGRYVASGSHRIIRNRNWLIIAPVANEAADHVLVEETDKEVTFAGGSITLKSIEPTHPFTAPAAATMACIDARQLHYPLILRRWKAGDYFYPLGMQKKKKLARFLIDQKVSKTDKEKVWVLESNKRIVWIIGMRIDDRFKVTASTHTALMMEFIPGAGNL